MPYKIFKDGESGKECVHKMDGEKQGALKHCYSGGNAHKQALAYMRALYAAEGSTKEIEDLDKELEGLDTKDVDSQLEQSIDAIADEYANRLIPGEDEHFVELLDDPEAEPDEEEKAKRADVTAADRKRSEAEYGNVTYADPTNKKYPIDTEKHIRAAWSYINMPKNASKYPDGGKAIKAKIVAAWKRVIDKSGPPEAAKKSLYEEVRQAVEDAFKSLFGKKQSDNGMLVYKEGNAYKWIARYSNNYRDQDNPPEIISSNSHQKFVEKVEKGLTPKPDLWLWHVKEWKMGQADWVAYDGDTGFALAGGHYYPYAYPLAEKMAAIKNIKVSHGMPKSTLEYDPADPSVIISHETREISPLPGWAAANKLTGFAVLDTENKEADMAIPADKRAALIKEWNISEDILAKIEQANVQEAEKATNEGLEQKEAPQTPEPAQTPEPVAQEKQPEQTPAAATPQAAEDEGVKQLKELLQGIVTRLDAIEQKQKAESEQLEKNIQQTPIASMLSMFKQQSAVGAPETQVDGRTSLAKQKPAEAKTAIEGRTVVPFINELLAGKPKGQQ